MLVGFLALGLLQAVPVSPAGNETPLLNVSYPKGTPDFSSWEKTWGKFLGDMTWQNGRSETLVEYEFYVNPEKQALYEVVMYRARKFRIVHQGEAGSAAGTVERFLWNRSNLPGRYFALEYKRTWRTLWLAKSPVWLELSPGSDEYTMETANLLALFAKHRELLQERDAAAQKP
jgi:hypothetical protein